MGHLLISKIYGYCIYALAVFTKKIKPNPNTFVFYLGFGWRKEWDSLRDNYYFYLFFRILISYSFFFILSLSRQGCKQPFHRLFGRLVISKKTGILYEPTSNPFESHDWRKKIRIHFKCLRILWRKEWDSNPRYVAVYLISSQGRYDHFDIFP